MMMHIRKLMVAMMFASAAMSGCGFDPVSSAEEGDSAAMIHSSEDLNDYLVSAASSPLDRLSPAARQRFLDSLVFGDGELGSYSYADLEAELSVSQIHDILSLFGVERTTSMIGGARVTSDRDRELMTRPSPGGLRNGFTMEDDHVGYKCLSRATCVVESGHICMTGC